MVKTYEVFRLIIPTLVGFLSLYSSSISHDPSQIWILPVASAWDWTDYVRGGGGGLKSKDEDKIAGGEIS